MEIIDLTEKYEKCYFCCLEEWSEEMKDAGDHKEQWYRKMKGKGLRVKVAIENDVVCGMIQYLPSEHSFIEGDNLYFINCIWVHGYKKGIGNFQKQGIGKALLAAAEEDVRSMNRLGIAAWGLSLPFWMKASWYRKHGLVNADKNGVALLVWKPYSDIAVPPKWIKQQKKPEKVPNQVTVTSFIHGWCPASNMVHERAKRAVMEFDERVVFRVINTVDRDVFLEWGISDGLFIDDTEVTTGPPLSYKKIQRLIQKQVNKLKR